MSKDVSVFQRAETVRAGQTAPDIPVSDKMKALVEKSVSYSTPVKGGSMVVLVNLIIDDSGSIKPYVPDMCQQHNRLLARVAAEQKAHFLIQTMTIHNHVLNYFCQPHEAEKMDPENFPYEGLTPLYDGILTGLATTALKCHDMLRSGTLRVPSINLIVSDADENDSKEANIEKVRKAVEAMVGSDHVVAAFGFNSPLLYRFGFEQMGVPQDWIFPTAEVSNFEDLFNQVFLHFKNLTS